jgi:hypothetical protein
MKGNPLQVSTLEDGCIQCLLYFGIFHFPLTAEEVYQFNPFRADPAAVERALNDLVNKRKVFTEGQFFLPVNEPGWITERKHGRKRALDLLNRSGHFVSIIAGFPFVRAVAISGSLSKFYASTEPDIDYFIITESNRLWIARTLLHLFKKLTFITGHQHYYCMNYFVDEENLEIMHQNQYSAIELVTLLPAFNRDILMEFMEKNKWVDDYLPNHPGILNYNYLIKTRKRPVKQFAESVFNVLFPERFNRFLMKLTDRKWRKKWKRRGYAMKEYDRAFHTSLHISKNHPVDYEKMVLESLESKNTK